MPLGSRHPSAAVLGAASFTLPDIKTEKQTESEMYSVFSEYDSSASAPGSSSDLDELAAQLDSAETLWEGLGIGAATTEITTELPRGDSVASDLSSITADPLGASASVNSPDSGFPDDLMEGLVADDFSNLDINSLLADSTAASCHVKDEPLCNSPGCDIKAEADAGEEPYTFLNDQGMQGLENGGQPDDTIKTDCMWSSSLTDFLGSSSSAVNAHKSSRTREDSLTLSECAESLFKDLKDVDLMGASSSSSSGRYFGSSPGVQGMLRSYMGGKTGPSCDNSDDEEIDVVSDCSDSRSTSSSTVSAATTASSTHSSRYSGNSSSSRTYNNSLSRGGKRVPTVRAGQSLLRSNRHNMAAAAQAQQQQQARQQQQQRQQQVSNPKFGSDCFPFLYYLCRLLSCEKQSSHGMQFLFRS